MAKKVTRRQIQSMGKTQIAREHKQKIAGGQARPGSWPVSFRNENRAAARRAQRINKGR